MDCTVSVVIPVYNGAAFIARAIDSALAQSYRPHEIIVVNDGSRDRTAEVLAGYGGRIRVISIANGGVSNARNIGMHASSGELIAFLDADDVWHPNKLQVQVAAMHAYPRAGLCCCDYLVLNRHLGHMVNHFSICPKGITYDRPFSHGLLPALIDCNFIGTASTVMLRRTLLHEAGWFNVLYRQAEDYDYWLRCAAHTSFLVLADRLMEKKTHDSNLTNDGIDMLSYHERVLCDLADGALLGSAGNAHLPGALAKVRLAIARLLFEQGSYWPASAYCLSALRTRPRAGMAAQVARLLCKKTLVHLLRRMRKPRSDAARLPNPSFGNK